MLLTTHMILSAANIIVGIGTCIVLGYIIIFGKDRF